MLPTLPTHADALTGYMPISCLDQLTFHCATDTRNAACPDVHAVVYFPWQKGQPALYAKSTYWWVCEG
jgi:hypothetical protein